MERSSVLVINCGSSSIKFSLVHSETNDPIIKGIAERLGSADAVLKWMTPGGDGSQPLGDVDHRAAMESIGNVLKNAATLETPLVAVGHRVVHGGEAFSQSTRIDERVLAAIESCNHLAPLHNPANLLGIRTAQHFFPNLPHVAVFDTAFHHALPERAYLYAVPYSLYKDHGIRRYGFHGTSHRYVTQRAAFLLGRRLEECAFVSAHLGNGCSACAVLGGKSVDTTMGLTPLEGLVMGTRSGDVDPGLHAYLKDQLNWTLEQITNTLNRESGLLGISGLSNDMRELVAAAEKGHPHATLAIEVFCYRLAKSLAALFVSLGQVGTVIFTGGIGENAPSIRANVVQQLAYLGFEIHPDRNTKHGTENKGRITRDGQRIAMVVPTDEEIMIARDTLALIK
jgi:acetate kinase